MLESIDVNNKEIDNKEKALAALNKRQFELMLNNDAAGMDALDKDIAEAEKRRDMLKTQLGQVMGADIRGQRGNQLTQTDSGSYIDGMLHAYGNIGDGVKAEQERKNEAAAYQGMLPAHGNIGDGVMTFTIFVSVGDNNLYRVERHRSVKERLFRNNVRKGD